ncbi:MAG: hypothetical protein ACHQHO_09515 [Solirubrobacterales bacterium]
MSSARDPRSKPVACACASLAASALAACTLAACGSSTHSSSSVSSTQSGGTRTATVAQAARQRGPRGCAAAVAATIGRVGTRIYDAASSGTIVGQAVRRVRSSSVLAAAVSSGDKAAAEHAVRGLLAGQIVRIQVFGRRRLLASAGSTPAIAPVHGSIPGTHGTFVLSTQAADSYLHVTRQVTGAEIALLSGASPGGSSTHVLAATLAGLAPQRVPHSGKVDLHGKRYEVFSLAGSTYPSGRLRIALIVPTRSIRCPQAAAQTSVQTLGQVGERIYQEEAGSPYVHATLRHIEADPSFRRAIVARDTKAIRAAIVGLFGAHIHVVRVRAYAVQPSGAQRLLYDLGGPYVLAPVHGTVRSAGKLVGRFSFAIQDDAGYLRLARLFTGAEVLMRVGSAQVMGTLAPGPASVPDRGAVVYRGKTYEAYSFSGEAFPSGPLRISLLIPKG